MWKFLRKYVPLDRDTLFHTTRQLTYPGDNKMGLFCLALIAILCAVCSSLDGISGSEVELRVRPGDNVTLYCDCTLLTGISIIWFRNCSHENQPTLVIQQLTWLSVTDTDVQNVRESMISDNYLNPFPHFTLQWNPSNNTYDLLIENITESDLGLYYCGTKETKVVDEGGTGGIKQKEIYHYGNLTYRLLFGSEVVSATPSPPAEDCRWCWILLFSLCPVSALLSSPLSFSCFYVLCRKTAQTESRVPPNRMTTSGMDSRYKEEGDLCYAPLVIRQGQTRPKKKSVQNSDFSTYSAINTIRV
ncbi:hypothetical protein DPEC_G00181340 [Dallia pectoralis]|uniref:Uncharacterized protein n=1 Tax=Dallia pectoralis TaxID=75939 RepID=A0ACC2GAB1_DALPE|nr:hypothetical protein DPEC_G00181340 [Dallia pectoralis]